MNWFCQTSMKIMTFLASNGEGRPSTSFEISGSSGLAKLLAGLLAFLGNLASWIWSLFISVIYDVAVKFCLQFVDLLQYFVEKLVGIDIYKQEGGLAAVESLKDTDIIINFILQERILQIFKSIMLIGLILLIVFLIFAIVKSNYEAAANDAKPKKVYDIFRSAFKAMFLMLIVPVLLIFGILGSNAVLASICNAISGGNRTTIGGLIFTASAYNANQYRQYANAGIRIPISYHGGTDIINPSEYKYDEDMQKLFFQLAKGEVYIKYVSDNEEFRENVGYNDPNEYPYKPWLETMTIEYIEEFHNTGKAGSYASNVWQAFSSDYDNFLKKYCEGEPLSYLGSSSPIISSIYNTNLRRNDMYDDKRFDFSSTYEAVREGLAYSTTVKKEDGSIVADTTYVDIFGNTEIYQGFEPFATIENEYLVMADLIDYAVENEIELFFVNAGNKGILWENIVVDFAGEESTINIESYNSNMAIYKSKKSGMYYLETEVQKDGDSYKVGDTPVGKVANSSFYVHYYDGTKRLYWSEDINQAQSEDDGATYIICTKSDTGYVPLTQTTSSFTSGFLADSYGGPIVARGLFEKNTFANSDNVPTTIREQKIDADGHEISNINTESPFSVVGNGESVQSGMLKEKFQKMVNSVRDLFYTPWESENLKNIADSYYYNDLVSSVSYSGNRVTFYDSVGRKMSLASDTEIVGASYADAYTTEANITPQAGYFILQTDFLGGDIIPWYSNSALDLTTFTSLKTMYENAVIVVKYLYDEISFNHDGTNYKMLANFRLEGMNTDGGDTFHKTIQCFVYEKRWFGLGADKQRLTTLTILGNSIYDANGDIFFDIEDARDYYDQFEDLYRKRDKDLLDYLFNTYVVEHSDSTTAKNVLDKVKGMSVFNGKSLVNQEALLGAELVAGMSAQIVQNQPAYYSITYEDIGEKEGAGSITYYNESGKIITTETFSARNPSGSSTSTMYVAVIMDFENENGEAKPSLKKVAGALPVADTNFSISIEKEMTNFLSYNEEVLKGKLGISSLPGAAKVYVYEVLCTYKYTEFTKSGGGNFYLNAGISSLELATNSDGKVIRYVGGVKETVSPASAHLSVQNGNIYCNSLREYVLSRNPAKSFISNKTSDATASYADDGSTVKDSEWDTASFSSFEDFYIYFYREKLKGGLYLDFQLFVATSLKVWEWDFVFRFKLAWVNKISESVIYHLDAGGFSLNYLFRENTGIGLPFLYTYGNIDPIVLVFSTTLVISILLKIIWGLIARIYEIVIMFILLPGYLSTMPIDDGKRFNDWKDGVIKKVLMAYGTLIMLNLYFVLVPLVREVTDGLLVYEELPSTVTGMISSIRVAGGNMISSISTFFSAVGTEISNAFASISTGISSFISSIKTGAMNGSLLGAIGLGDANLTSLLGGIDTQKIVMEYLNKIVYLLFFLVLTTMLSSGAKMIEGLVGSEDLSAKSDSTKAAVKENVDKAASYTSGKALVGTVASMVNTAKTFAPTPLIDVALGAKDEDDGVRRGGFRGMFAGEGFNSEKAHKKAHKMQEEEKERRAMEMQQAAAQNNGGEKPSDGTSSPNDVNENAKNYVEFEPEDIKEVVEKIEELNKEIDLVKEEIMTEEEVKSELKIKNNAQDQIAVAIQNNPEQFHDIIVNALVEMQKQGKEGSEEYKKVMAGVFDINEGVSDEEMDDVIAALDAIASDAISDEVKSQINTYMTSRGKLEANDEKKQQLKEMQASKERLGKMSDHDLHAEQAKAKLEEIKKQEAEYKEAQKTKADAEDQSNVALLSIGGAEAENALNVLKEQLEALKDQIQEIETSEEAGDNAELAEMKKQFEELKNREEILQDIVDNEPELQLMRHSKVSSIQAEMSNIEKRVEGSTDEAEIAKAKAELESLRDSMISILSAMGSDGEQQLKEEQNKDVVEMAKQMYHQDNIDEYAKDLSELETTIDSIRESLAENVSDEEREKLIARLTELEAMQETYDKFKGDTPQLAKQIYEQQIAVIAAEIEKLTTKSEDTNISGEERESLLQQIAELQEQEEALAKTKDVIDEGKDAEAIKKAEAAMTQFASYHAMLRFTMDASAKEKGAEVKLTEIEQIEQRIRNAEEVIAKNQDAVGNPNELEETKRQLQAEIQESSYCAQEYARRELQAKIDEATKKRDEAKDDATKERYDAVIAKYQQQIAETYKKTDAEIGEDAGQYVSSNTNDSSEIEEEYAAEVDRVQNTAMHADDIKKVEEEQNARHEQLERMYARQSAELQASISKQEQELRAEIKRLQAEGKSQDEIDKAVADKRRAIDDDKSKLSEVNDKQIAHRSQHSQAQEDIQAMWSKMTKDTVKTKVKRVVADKVGDVKDAAVGVAMKAREAKAKAEEFKADLAESSAAEAKLRAEAAKQKAEQKRAKAQYKAEERAKPKEQRKQEAEEAKQQERIKREAERQAEKEKRERQSQVEQDRKQYRKTYLNDDLKERTRQRNSERSAVNDEHKQKVGAQIFDAQTRQRKAEIREQHSKVVEHWAGKSQKAREKHTERVGKKAGKIVQDRHADDDEE